MSISIGKLKLIFEHSLLKFATVGVINTLLSIAVIFSLKSMTDVSDVMANFIGYMVGLICSFVLNKQWTFKSVESLKPTLLKFLVVFCFSYALNISLVLASINFGVNDYLAHLLGIPLYSTAFYFGCKYFAFPIKATKLNNNEEANVVILDSVDSTDLLREFNSLVMESKFIWLIGTIFLAAAVIFYRLGALPVETWDEARLANNALEMSQTGLSLITTYGGLTDYWNTKPPLLIWLMSISISIFGSNEWSVRLPSALSAMATITIVFAFCTYHLKRPIVGFFSVALLLLTSGYVQFHCARAGDYDSLLTLWTTSYLISGYVYFHAEAGKKTLWFYLCMVCIVLAFFTKTIQGLIFLPGLLLYAISQKKLTSMLRSPELYLGIVFVLTACVGYYLLRENVDPGYFSYAKANDLLGRYNNTLESEPTKPYYYIVLKAYPLTILAVILLAYQFFRAQSSARQLSIYLGLISIFYIIIISLSATKHAWYLDPICPLVAIIVAVSINQAFEWAVKKYNYAKQTLVISVSLVAIIFSVGVIAANNHKLLIRLNSMKADELNQYNFFIRSPTLENNNFTKFVIIHPGYHNNFQPEVPYYAPLLFYVNSLRVSGKTILIQPPTLDIPSDYNIAVLCGNHIYDAFALKVNLRDIKKDSSCGIYAIYAK